MTSADSSADTFAPAAVTSGKEADRCVCPSCGSAGQDRFCPACGQKRFVGRHTLRGLARDAFVRLAGEEGLLGTAVQLSLTPGRVIRDYLAGRTVPTGSPSTASRGYSRAFERRRVLAALAGALSLVLGGAAWLSILAVLIRLRQ